MTFYELKELLNDNSIIKIYNANHDFVKCYDGKEHIPETFDDFEINDIFSDIYYNLTTDCAFSAISIELEFYKYEGDIYNE